jgi:hypothetical protein
VAAIKPDLSSERAAFPKTPENPAFFPNAVPKKPDGQDEE